METVLNKFDDMLGDSIVRNSSIVRFICASARYLLRKLIKMSAYSLFLYERRHKVFLIIGVQSVK